MNEKERGRSAGTEATPSKITQTQLISLSELCQTEKLELPDLKTVLDISQLKPREAVKVIKKEFPSFDQPALSKCLKPEKYGMVLHPHGYMELAKYVKFDIAPQAETTEVAVQPTETVVRRKPDNRKYNNRISGRVPDELYKRLQELMEEKGYRSMQEWIYEMVCMFVREAGNGELCASRYYLSASHWVSDRDGGTNAALPGVRRRLRNHLYGHHRRCYRMRELRNFA